MALAPTSMAGLRKFWRVALFVALAIWLNAFIRAVVEGNGRGLVLLAVALAFLIASEVLSRRLGRRFE